MNFKRCPFAFIFLVVFFSCIEVNAQRIYVDAAIPNGGVFQSGNLADGTYNATLFSLFGSSASLKLNYSNQQIDAGITTYIKVNLNSIADITLDAYNNNILLSKPTVKLVLSTNESFLAVTPIENYNSIKVTLIPKAANSANIYYAFNGYQSDCGGGWTSSFSIISNSGTTVDPLSTVNGQTNSVDADTLTYSNIYIKAQQKDVVISQTIYFSSLVSATELAKIYLSETPGFSRNAVKATVQAFLNATAVNTPIDIFSIVPANGKIVPVEIAPGKSFDRVTISVTPSSNANQNYAINVHEAQALPSKPSLNISSGKFCQYATGSISIANPVTGVQYSWYKDNTLLQRDMLTSYSPTSLPVGPNELKVTASRPGCLESSPESVFIIIDPKPITPNIQSIN